MSFKVPNISIAGGPTVDWNFTDDIAHAECDGAKAYAEMRSDGSADLRITDAAGEVLADVIVRKLPADETITVSVMNVGTALLWSHARWSDARVKAPAVTGPAIGGPITPNAEHILQFFAYEQLPPHLQAVSKPFGELARIIVGDGEMPAGAAVQFPLPRNPERTVALRKLLEAKDAAVRALAAK
jgi:hypothetical protein